jgi:hypothetical protein
MLKGAEALLDRSTARDRVEADKDSFWVEVENLQSDSPDQRMAATYVGFAAAKTVTRALYDEDFQTIDDREKDDDLDPYMWDADFYAAGAAAGGFPWEESSSVARRREFWQWYLEHAVPSAYEAR